MNNENQFISFTDISSDRVLLQTQSEPLPATSNLYIEEQVQQEGNDQARIITGVHIVLKKGHPNGLWEKLDKNPNESGYRIDPDAPEEPNRLVCLSFFCDTLEVHGHLHVPQTTVNICARRLIFETEDAAIETTPLPWRFNPRQSGNPGDPGADGLTAGHFNIALSELVSKNDPNHDKKRLIATGGAGQGPKKGEKGNDGTRYTAWISYGFKTLNGASRTVHLPDSAIYLHGKHYNLAGFVGANYYHGEKDNWPTSGGHATPPGKPGLGGKGGNLVCNHSALSPHFHCPGGQSGTPGPREVGGRAGSPDRCNKYTIEIKPHFFDHDDQDVIVTPQRQTPWTTMNGNDGYPVSADSAVGEPGKSSLYDQPKYANAWLVPQNLKVILEYARDLFLAGRRKQAWAFLSPYEQPLTAPMPETPFWDKSTAPEWVSAQLQVASMVQRLRHHLDYFGNPGGYMPFLSLQSVIHLYQQETRRSLKTLLLVDWITGLEQQRANKSQAFLSAIDQLNNETRNSATEITKTDEQIREVIQQAEEVNNRLIVLRGELETVKRQLKDDAERGLFETALIDVTVDVAATLCMVIPVGQPVLGIVGSLASVAKDVALEKGTGVEAIGKAGEIFSDAADNMVSQAQKVKAAAEEARQQLSTEEQSEKAALEQATKRADAAKNFGSALSFTSQQLGRLQVPKDEVDAEIERLKAQSPRYGEVTQKIRELNEKSALFAQKVTLLSQVVSRHYARITSNSTAVFRMRQQLGDQTMPLGPETMRHLREMAKQSRLTLIKYLYLMGKSYETTVFKPIQVVQRLDAIVDQARKLAHQEAEFNDGSFDRKIVDDLEPLYTSNIDLIRRELLTHFENNRTTIETTFLNLNETDTPLLLRELNENKEVRIDPVRLNLIPPDRHLARLVSIELQSHIKTKGPELGAKNVTIKIQPHVRGTVRRKEHLFQVQGKATPYWTCNLIGGESPQMELSKTDQANRDLLNFIVGDEQETIKNKIASPALWADYYLISLEYQILREEVPIITNMQFKMEFDAGVVNQVGETESQLVVDIRTQSPEVITKVRCTEDKAGRKDGVNDMMRIYSKGSTITLKAEPQMKGQSFKGWDIIGNIGPQVVDLAQPEITLSVNENLIVNYAWEKA